MILQDDLVQLEDWERQWDMEFHALKCNAMTCTRSKEPITADYILHGQVLERVESTGYLGVTIQKDGQWSEHTGCCIRIAPPSTAETIRSEVMIFLHVFIHYIGLLCASFQITNFIYPLPVIWFLRHGEMLVLSNFDSFFNVFREKTSLALALIDTDPYITPYSEWIELWNVFLKWKYYFL